MRKLKRIIKISLVLFLGFLVFLTGQTFAETAKINKEIKTFMDKGVYQPHLSEEGTIKFYKVSRETYYPNELKREPFFNGDLTKPGASGDILVTRQSPIPTYPGFYEFVSFYFGGHAAYIGENNNIYETFGFPNYDETLLDVIINGGDSTFVQVEHSNYWLDPNYRDDNSPDYIKFGNYYRKEWIGLRVKGVTDDEISQVTSYMDELVEKEAQYNHLYIFNTKNKYYCTDMMSRAYATITNSNGDSKYNLNKDGVVTTVNDLILSSDTYISYYVKTDKSNVKHVYYIG